MVYRKKYLKGSSHKPFTFFWVADFSVHILSLRQFWNRMVIVFWKRCILSLRFPTRSICLWTVSLFFLSEAVLSLMSLLLRSLPQPCFPPYSVLMEDPIQKSRFSRQSAEECIVILPVQGPLLTAVSPPGASTRPFTFYSHFLPHLPEFFVFLCSGYRLR